MEIDQTDLTNSWDAWLLNRDDEANSTYDAFLAGYKAGRRSMLTEATQQPDELGTRPRIPMWSHDKSVWVYGSTAYPGTDAGYAQAMHQWSCDLSAWSEKAERRLMRESGWVSVRDRLPEDFEDCLIWLKPINGSGEPHWSVRKGSFRNGTFSEWGENKMYLPEQYKRITHWRPHFEMPPLNEVEEQGKRP